LFDEDQLHLGQDFGDGVEESGGVAAGALPEGRQVGAAPALSGAAATEEYCLTS
jgi:hypothetical protein